MHYRQKPSLVEHTRHYRQGLNASVSLNFISGNTASNQINFVRNTNATMYRPGDGWLVFAPNNLCQWSEDQTQTGWVQAGSTIALSTDFPAPAGTTNVTKIMEDSSSGQHRSNYSGVSLVSGRYYTASLDIHAGERTSAFIQMGASTNFQNGNPGLIIDLNTGIISNPSSAVISSSSTNLGNGWFRVSITGLCILATSTGSISIFGAIGTNPSYQGVVGNGVYVTGVQFEVGPYAQAYNPTAGAIYFGPRLDTDPTSLSPLGLLIEESRTNLLLWSNDFTQTQWTKTDVSVSLDATISPEGIANCNLATEGTAGTANMNQTSGTFTANFITTGSMFLKRGNHDWIRLRLVDGPTGADGCNLYINLATGILGSIVLVGAGSGFTATIQSLPNGWFRITLTGLTNATTTTASLQVLSATSDGNGTRIPNATHYVYGGQLEATSTTSGFATSYIPTVNATANRAADIVTIPLSSWYNQTQGSVYVSAIKANAVTSPVSFAYAFDDGTNNSRITLNYQNAEFDVFVSAVGQAQIINATKPIAGQVNKFASAYNTNDFSFVENGTLVGTDTNGTIPTVTTCRIGADATARYFNGWIRSFAYYPSRVPDSQLQSLST